MMKLPTQRCSQPKHRQNINCHMIKSQTRRLEEYTVTTICQSDESFSFFSMTYLDSAFPPSSFGVVHLISTLSLSTSTISGRPGLPGASVNLQQNTKEVNRIKELDRLNTQ